MKTKTPTESNVRAKNGSYTVSRYKQTRHWAVVDPVGVLVCVALYKKGANEATKRLNAARKDRN